MERAPGIGREWGRILLAVLLLPLSACSIRSLAVNGLADSLAASGDVFASDEDPALVRDALPFALKTMETLLAEKPEHRGLLLSACSGFTQYGYAFVEAEAERLDPMDYRAASAQRERALKLYLRARDYCLRSLEVSRPGIRGRLEMDPDGAAEELTGEELDLVYWTGASWGAAISLAKDRPEIVVDLPVVKALMELVLDLDESFGQGAAHEAMISLEALPETMGGSHERARQHFERAVELSGGTRAGPYASYAASVVVAEQRRGEFKELLNRALAIDPDAAPSYRLANLVVQERCRRLLARVDDLFLEGGEEDLP